MTPEEAIRKQRKEEFYALHYPRWIYKDGEEPIQVSNPYEHADKCEEGWGGPPIFYPDDVKDLKEQVEETRVKLKQLEIRLAQVEGRDHVDGQPDDGNEPGSSADAGSTGDSNGDSSDIGDGPFVCPDCGKELKTKEGLTGHMMKHKK